MGQRSGGRRRWASAVLALVLGVGAVASCGGDDSPAGGSERSDRDEQSETTAASDDATSTTLSPTQEVEEAFIAFNAMMDRLRESPDPTDPEIAQRASGETLAGITDAQTTLQTTGFSARFGERNSVEILSVTMVEPATAVVHECKVEDLTEVNASGETNGPFVRTYWTEWTFIKVGETWFADSSDGIDRQEGVHPCE